jgi:hypothetical protein
MKAGYKGKDEMRERAEKAFGNSLKEVTAPAKMSASRPGNLKPRLYKKGGHVAKAKKCNVGGAIAGAAPANPFSMGAQSLPQDPSKKRMGFKKGGKVKAKKMNAGGYSMPATATPGFSDIANMAAGRPPAAAPRNKLVGPVPDLGGFKKGGKIKKMAMGGVGKIRHKQATASGKAISKKRKGA